MIFPIYQNPIHLSQLYWRQHVKKGDTVLDATLGNGYDTLFLAKCCLTKDSGQVISFDIQEQALTQSKKMLEDQLPPWAMKHITLKHQSHVNLNTYLALKPSLIVYNLGYLPRGNKNITTMPSTSLESIEKVLKESEPSTLLSLISYVGHKEGLEESTLLEKYFTSLSKKQFSCCCHMWKNREKSPILWIIQKQTSL